MLDRSPVDARPTPGHLGDLFVTLDDESRARGANSPVPVQRPIADAPTEVQAPILTYHRTAGPAALQAQFEGLMDAGLTPVSFEHLVAAIEGWAELPDKAFVVSFDDGWLDQIDGALPVLQELRVPAVFFVLPGFDRHGQGHMTLADIQSVRAAGVTVGSHTINHADLPPLYRNNLGAAQAEVVESRQWLEADIDGVDYFAYPLGRFDPDVAALVAAAEYRAAVTTVPGIVHNLDRLFELRRVGVEAWWPLQDVIQKIRGRRQDRRRTLADLGSRQERKSDSARAGVRTNHRADGQVWQRVPISVQTVRDLALQAVVFGLSLRVQDRPAFHPVRRLLPHSIRNGRVCLAHGAHARHRRNDAVIQLQHRLHVQQRSQECLGAANAPAALQVLQGLHHQEDVRPLRVVGHEALDVLHAGPLAPGACGGQHAEAHRRPHQARVQHQDLAINLGRALSGRLDRLAEVR